MPTGDRTFGLHIIMLAWWAVTRRAVNIHNNKTCRFSHCTQIFVHIQTAVVQVNVPDIFQL